MATTRASNQNVPQPPSSELSPSQRHEPDQYPLAAQIPLSSFTLPNFPAAASRLRSLTVTSDLSLDTYQSEHLQPGTFEPPSNAAPINLPPSITHLTLELFSLGFPAPFLSELGKALPELQSLTLFSCLVDGLDEPSRRDTVKFFDGVAGTLRELHIVDSFARAGLWKKVGEAVSASPALTKKNPRDVDTGLKLLEVSYTYRGHHESDFLNRVAGEEWAEFITPDLVGLSLNFASPPADESTEVSMQAEKEEDQEALKAQDGILPFASDGRASLALRKKFEALTANKDSVQLKVLNLSMYCLHATEAAEIVYACAGTGASGNGGLVGMVVSLLLEEGWWETLKGGMAHSKAGQAMESLEVVGVPTAVGIDVGEGDEIKLALEDAEKLLMKSEEGIKAMNESCPDLSRFEMTILKSRRIGSVVWEKNGGVWKMQRHAQPTTS